MDADATAIYGSRGANGVILITTKRGKAGKTNVDINAFSGVGKVAHRIDLLNTRQYLAMRHEAFDNDGVQPGTTDYDINGTWDTTRYTDWQKTFIGGTSRFTRGQTTISGGNANTQFLISGTYSNQITVYPADFPDQKAAVNVSIQNVSENQKFHSQFSAAYVNDNSVLPQSDYTSLITLAPDAPALHDGNGNLNWQNNTWTNPFASLLQKAKAVTSNLIGNINLRYEILPGLEVKGALGYNSIQVNQSNTSPLVAFSPSYANFPTLRTNVFGNNGINTWIIEPQINYKKRIAKGDFSF